MKNDFVFSASDGAQLSMTTYGNPTEPSRRCVIFVHGFKGFKDWGFVPPIGQYLSDRGFFLITFNFSHNGIGDQPSEFTELDKFAENSFSREIRELSELINACGSGFFGAKFEEVGLVGHSRGGAMTLLTAARKNEVKAAVTWAAVAQLDRYSDAVKKRWRETGYIEIKNMRTGQIMKLNSTLLDDVEKNKGDLLNIEKAVKDLDRPLLIIHGENDEAVPHSEAEQLYGWGDPAKCELIKIPHAGHTFGAAHPWAGFTDDFEMVLDLTAKFFDKNL